MSQDDGIFHNPRGSSRQFMIPAKACAHPRKESERAVTMQSGIWHVRVSTAVSGSSDEVRVGHRSII